MGKIWLKTKLDSAMGMEIPHSINIANAMYGFRELGAEIIPYHTLDEIYEKVEKEDIVLDYVDQCNAVFKKFGVTPSIPDYPQSMERFLGRKVWRDTINNFSSDETKWSAGYFVKPVEDKRFTGKIIKDLKDLIGCGSCYENYEIIVSEPIDIVAEWRCFWLYDKIVDIRPYGSVSNPDYDGYLYCYDEAVLKDMMSEFLKWQDRPNACSMDICVTKDHRTLLVEMNDAYALGCYGLPPLLYAKLLSARWSQLLNRADEYHF